MKFTDEQKKVIEARGKNLLVSAAAGSGKTAVLVERIYHLITGENAVDVDRLLVLTFTRAAAAEMKERVRKRLDEALESDPLNENLLHQEGLLHNAQITTIDSFCNYILRENFTKVDIDPSYRIADAGELKLMSEDVLENVLEELFEEGEESFLHCCEYFTAGESTDRIKEYIKDLYGKAQSMPDPVWWLTEKPWKKRDILSECLQYMGRILNELAVSMEHMITVCDEPDGPAAYVSTIMNEAAYYRRALAVLEEASTKEVFDQFREALLGIEYERLKTISAKSDVNPDKKQLVKATRDEAKKVVKGLIGSFLNADGETVSHLDEITMQAGDELCEITLRYLKALDEAKREKNIFDFNDIEHLALQALTTRVIGTDGEVRYEPTAEALSYQEYFAEVMTDEYQDSNLIQELILNAVARDGRRFMVGDVKQSIYRFRLARPEIFMQKLSAYTQEGAGPGRRIDLHKNFRSRSQVLDFTNRVFEKIMACDLGGVDYDTDARLVVGREFADEKSPDYNPLPYACEMLMTPSGSDKEETEALLVAGRILELIQTMQVEGKDELSEQAVMRPLRFGDIVLLMRATSGRDEVYRRVLESKGIPVYAESKTGFFDTKEVSCMMNLLTVLNNPLQDIAFVSVMHSEIGAFTDEELAQIKVWGTGDDADGAYFSELAEHFVRSPKSEDQKKETLRQKTEAFLNILDRLREQSVYLSVAELLQEVFDQTGYMDCVSCMPGGTRRATNLRRLLEKAKSYEQSCYRGLHRFIRYIEQLRELREDEGEANILDENANVVRIMSIHRSKGLQFPVVFLCNASGGFNLRDAQGKLIADSDYGVAPAYVDIEKGFYLSTLRRKMIAQHMKEATIGEELRVLYVAMTRAEEKLILTQTIKEPPSQQVLMQYAASLQGGVLPYLFRSSTIRYSDFVLAALGADASFSQMEQSSTETEVSLSSPDKQLQIRYFYPREEVFEEAVSHADYAERKRLLGDTNHRLPASGIAELLSERFSFVYAHDAYQNLFTKTTVTELKEALRDEGDDVSVHLYELQGRKQEQPRPSFMREEESTQISGAARGVLYHKMMELMDEEILYRRKHCNDRELFTYFEKCEQEGRLSADWRVAVRLTDFLRFLQTDLATRMQQALTAGKLKRESQFMMGIPARELDKKLPEHEILLIQGIIDCWFEEEDGIVIVDYKTDHVQKETELTERYTTQLDYYERALRQITGKAVKERILYSFALGTEVRC